MSTNDISTITQPATEPDGSTTPTFETGYQAFLQVEPEIVALPPDDIIRVNADVPRACAIALGALPAIRELRPAIVARFVGHPVALLDRLELYTLAAYYAHLLAMPQPRDVAKVQALFDEATPLRMQLLLQAESLARAGLLPMETVAEIRSGTGFIGRERDGRVPARRLRTRDFEVRRARERGKRDGSKGARAALTLAALGDRRSHPD